MKVKVLSNPITPYGAFHVGQVLTSDKYPESFLNHLVKDCGAASYVEDQIAHEVKAVDEKKSSPLSRRGRLSLKKTSKPAEDSE